MVDYSKWDHMGSSSEDDADSGFGLSPRGGAMPLQMLAGDGADLVSALLGQLGIVDLEEAAPSSAAKSSAPVRGLDDLSATESKADDMLDVAGLGGTGGAAAPLLLRHVAPLRELAARSPAELFARAGSDDAAQRLFTRLARMLNDGADAEGAELDNTARVRVLEALGDAARERRKRHLVLGALGELSESFEAVLRDHEAGRRKYGRQVGALHSLMLVALCRVLDYNMGAGDLLELVSGDAALAMELVVSVAKGAAYEDLLFVALCRLLCGLTQPDTYAQASGLAEDPGSAVAAAAVAQRMSTLVRHAMSANIVAQMSECLAKRFAPKSLPGRPAGAGPPAAASASEGAGAAGEGQSGAASPIAVVGTCEHLATVALLGAVHNVYLFAADGAAATEYRQHLLAATPLCAQIVLPYIARCFVLPLPPPSGAVSRSAAPEAAQAPRAPPTLNEDPLLRAGMLVALKVAVTAAFRLKASHKAAAAFAADSAWLTEALLGARGSFWRRPAHAELLSLLLLLNVNTGSLSPPTAGAVVVGGAPVLGALRRALAPLAKAAQATAAAGGDGTDRERERRRGQLCAIADSVEGVDGGDLPVGRDGAGYAALSELLSSMLGDGEATGAAAELAAPAPAGKDDAPVGGAVGGASAPAVAEAKAVAVSGSNAASAKAESKAAQAAAAGGMLDDLPQMGSPLSLPRRASVVKDGSRTTDDERQVRRERRRKRQARRGKREKGAPTGGGAAGAGELAGGDGGGADTAPERFRCAINGHVMKEPVRSPHGQTFERATIEQWLMRQGSICPFTGNELQKSQLVRAEDLESEIAVFHVRRAMAASAQISAVGSSGAGPRAADDDADDLYDF